MLKLIMTLAYLLGHSQMPRAMAQNLILSSPAFHAGDDIPMRYTCVGADVSIPLYWRGVPSGARSLVLVVKDPDASPSPWYHWALYDISPQLKRLNADMHMPPVGVKIAKNSWGNTYYQGPCPQRGRHHYEFDLMALDTKLNFVDGVDVKTLSHAMKGHVLAKTTLVAFFSRNQYVSRRHKG